MDFEIRSISKGQSISSLFFEIFNRESNGIRFAVNEEFVGPETVLKTNDIIAFIPPLGGG